VYEPSPSARYWARWFCLLLSCFLSLYAYPASAAEQPILPSELTPLILHLQKADALLTTLEADLEKQSGEARSLASRLVIAYDELSKLNEELVALRASLNSSETLRKALWEDLSVVRTALDSLMTKYARLSQDFSAYRSAAEQTIRSLERGRKAWMAVGIGSIIAAIVAGTVAAVR
jgi:chromosome segregation ATPase